MVVGGLEDEVERARYCRGLGEAQTRLGNQARTEPQLRSTYYYTDGKKLECGLISRLFILFIKPIVSCVLGKLQTTSLKVSFSLVNNKGRSTPVNNYSQLADHFWA